METMSAEGTTDSSIINQRDGQKKTGHVTLDLVTVVRNMAELLTAVAFPLFRARLKNSTRPSSPLS